MPIHNLPINISIKDVPLTITLKDEDKIFYKVLERMVQKKRKTQKIPYIVILQKVSLEVQNLLIKICREQQFGDEIEDSLEDSLEALAGPKKNTVSICEEQDELA